MRRAPEIADDRHRRVLGAGVRSSGTPSAKVLGLVEDHVQMRVRDGGVVRLLDR
jgi:hypothetical protein